MATALALSERGRGLTAPNPNVGCVIVRDGIVVGRGWTQPGGRPHAEAMALEQAGDKARGATVYITLEPCAHRSPRGPACADSLVAAGPARVVASLEDPDPRTAGAGFARLRAAGIAVDVRLLANEARQAMAGFLMRRSAGRPFVTLKLATSLDGRIALADGSSRWITGDAARAHVHLERARHEAILVGRGTWEADAPRLDVRLPGLETRSPRRILLSSSGPLPSSQPLPSPQRRLGSMSCDESGDAKGESDGPQPSALPKFILSDAAGGVEGLGRQDTITSPQDISALEAVDHLFVEGGAQTAASFLRADLVDRLLLYRAPILIGTGKSALGDIGLTDLAGAHGRWRLSDARMLGRDRLEVYQRARS
jgi:diaminohydroxyphosphoribosylaminopyrimidine deaminase/5-amino-6-(5-phosphoribosylamino)uracil reductase